MSTVIESDPHNLTEDDVITYLRGDPDFFQRHAALLSELNLPHDSGRAISLIERQVAILRERNMQMRRRMNELLQAAKENDELFAKTRTLTLELLNVHNWHELNEVLATYMLADFQADFVCCHLMNLPVHLDHLESHEAEPPYDRFVRSNAPVCTVLRADELAGLFPIQDHEQDGSAVLAPIFPTPISPRVAPASSVVSELRFQSWFCCRRRLRCNPREKLSISAKI